MAQKLKNNTADVRKAGETMKPQNKSWKQTYLSALKNFHFHFKVASYDDKIINFVFPSTDGEMRKNFEMYWDKPYETLFGNSQKYSSKYLTLTPSQYYSELDQAIIKSGNTEKNVSNAIAVFLYGKQEDADYQTLFETLLPIYIYMRKQGYYPTDLIE